MKFPYQLPPTLESSETAAIRARIEALAAASQYGWGHTIDFGPFIQPGILGSVYLDIADHLDARGWWSPSLANLRVADVGCFTGGLSLIMAARQPAALYAVDELAPHLDQARYLFDLFHVPNATCILDSVYRLDQHIPAASLDLILMSGVLYHLSDMLMGLYAMRELLKPGGVLLIESNAVNDMEQSYANFGRFAAGMWWQPSGLCLLDMCQFMGFEQAELFFHQENRCLVRAVRSAADEIPFRRGLNGRFASLSDAVERPMSLATMAPVKR